jgi:hypothetical protein
VTAAGSPPPDATKGLTAVPEGPRTGEKPDGDLRASAAEREEIARLISPWAFRPASAGGYVRIGKDARSEARDAADRVLAAGWVKAPTDEPNAWRIEVTVPLRLPVDHLQALFDAVCEAVEDWEPAPSHRDGWDADVAAHAVFDELLQDGSAVLRGGEQPDDLGGGG